MAVREILVTRSVVVILVDDPGEVAGDLARAFGGRAVLVIDQEHLPIVTDESGGQE